MQGTNEFVADEDEEDVNLEMQEHQWANAGSYVARTRPQKGQIELLESRGKSPTFASPRGESALYGLKHESNKFRQNRFANGPADHAPSFVGKTIKQTQTQKNSQVRKIELSTSPRTSPLRYGSSKDCNWQTQKGQMIQKLPPSVVLNSKQENKAQVPGQYLGQAQGQMTPTAGSFLSMQGRVHGANLGARGQYKSPQNISQGQSIASNSTHRKNQISKPIVPPHLKHAADPAPSSRMGQSMNNFKGAGHQGTETLADPQQRGSLQPGQPVAQQTIKHHKYASISANVSPHGSYNLLKKHKNIHTQANKEVSASDSIQTKKQPKIQQNTNNQGTKGPKGNHTKNAQSLKQVVKIDFSKIESSNQETILEKSSSKMGNLKGRVINLLRDDSAAKLSKLPYSSTQSQNSFLKNSFKNTQQQSGKGLKYQTLTSKAVNRIQKQKAKPESLKVSAERLDKPQYYNPNEKGLISSKQPSLGMQAQLHAQSILSKDSQGRIMLKPKLKMPTTQVHTLKNSMKNSACSSNYGTPTQLSIARNSQGNNLYQNDKPGGYSIGGQHQAILNINPHLNERLIKINQANEDDLADEESEGEMNEEDDGQGQEENEPQRIIDTISNKDGQTMWENNRKGSINNLPQMTIINLNQMQSKQKHLQQPPTADHLSPSYQQINLNMTKLTKEDHQTNARPKDLNLGGATASRLSSAARFTGQGGDPLIEEEVATDGLLPSSKLKRKDLQFIQEIKHEKIVVKANNGSQNIVFSGPHSNSLFAASAMSLRKKKAFVSKTAQASAQVSAYASKNNSNNSSLARGPAGAVQQKSKQPHHHELGTALKALKPTSQVGPGGTTKGSNKTSNSYKTQGSKFNQINSVQALQIENTEGLENLGMMIGKNREVLSGLTPHNQITGPKQSQQAFVKSSKAQPEKLNKKKIFKSNQSSLLSAVLSTNSSKQILNQTKQRTDAAFKVATNTPMRSGGINGGAAKITAQGGSGTQMTLKSKIKEKAHERRITAVEVKANAFNKRTGLVQQEQDDISMPTTLMESQNIREDSKYETDMDFHSKNKPSNFSSNQGPEGLCVNLINLIDQDPHGNHQGPGSLPSNRPSQPSSARDQPQADQPSINAYSHPQAANASLVKKKHLQPSQGSAQKKIQRARVGEQIPIASHQPKNPTTGRRQRSDRLRPQQDQDRDNIDATSNTHHQNPLLESRHNTNSIDFYNTPNTNKPFGTSSPAEASTEKQIELMQHETGQHFQIGNPRVSLCEPIDELNESESQQDKAQQLGAAPILTFNIGQNLQDQLNQNHKIKSSVVHLSPLSSPRLAAQVRERSSLVNQNDSGRKGGRGDSKISPVSNRNSNESNLENHSESSQQVQLREFYRDIQKLRKKIQLHFSEFKTMMPSSREFYRIGRVLGRGAFGKVNLACHKVCEHLVAIKSIEKKVLRNEKEQKRRVMQEMSILKQGGHENVVRLYDTFETNKHICFVMELCQGGDLLSYVRKRRKLKEDNAKYLFKQLIEGLNYIHTKKFVVHRDIKLDNILLDQSGRIKICDFGVSRQVKSEKERMHHQCGTPAYIAPEIIKERGYRGFKADMWSAGVCLYVMLIGTVPFRAATMEELHRLIKDGKYDFEGEMLSAQAQDLLKKLIQVNYRKRLSAEDALKHPWLQTTMDGKEPVDTTRSDLANIIFTDKEKQLITKDYLYRLEKIKQKRFRNSRENGSTVYQQAQGRKSLEYPRPNAQGHLNQLSHNSRIITDSDFIFTEHNLDTKEDDIHAGNQNLKDIRQNMIQDLFKKQQNDQENPQKGVFTKFEGFDVKPKMGKLGRQEIQNQSIQKNNSEKSIIFAPFNSSYSDFDDEHPELFQWPEDITSQLRPRKCKIIKYSKRCRDLNREYEMNNNADLDNGVYNAFVHEQEMEAEQQQMKKHQELQNEPDQVIFNDPNQILNDFGRGHQGQIPRNTQEDGGDDQELDQWGNRLRGSDQADSDDDMNDMTELSSDEEHALQAIMKNQQDRADQGNNDSQMTEVQELSIHESMQKIHELNLEQQDGGADGGSLMRPECQTHNEVPQIEEKIVQQTVDQFRAGPSEASEPQPVHGRDTNPFSISSSKNGPPADNTHKPSAPKSMIPGKSYLFNVTASMKEDKRRKAAQASTSHPAIDEYKQYGGNSKTTLLQSHSTNNQNVQQSIKEHLINSLQSQNINYLTAAYYLTMKNQFITLQSLM